MAAHHNMASVPTRCPTYTRGFRSTHRFDQAVVSTARHHRILCAEFRRGEFECRMTIVIEAADQTLIQHKRNTKRCQPFLNLFEKRTTFLVQIIREGRPQLRAPVALVLQIEDTQWIAF